jgi:S-DNA-T family DNA segregation ATPase FtsK/SpoIIIE
MSMHRTVGVYQPRSRRTQLVDTIASVREFTVGLVSETLRRALGLGLMFFALALLGALLSYNPADPSLDVATWRSAGNWLGAPGAYGADFLFQSVGTAAFALPLPLANWGWQLMSGRRLAFLLLRIAGFILGVVFLAAGLGALAQLPIFPPLAGGIAGQLVMVLVAKAAVALNLSLLSIVIPIVLAVSGTTLIVLSAGIRWRAIGFGFQAVFSVPLGVGLWLARLRFRRATRTAIQEDDEEWEYEEENEEFDDDDDLPGLAVSPEPLTAHDFSEKRVRRAEDRRPKVKVKSRLQPALNLAEGEYQLPPLSLLTEPPVETTTPAYSDDALEENARLLEAVLGDFGVRGRIVAVRPGPVVTLYELEPAAGVKSSRVVSLSDDIARSMSAVAARVAVIPGRNVIGIELPNLRRETVYLRELFSATEYEKSHAPLTLALGKTIGGEPVMADLAKMPHLLIAGTTGSGKSVALNTMILSLLYRMPPEHCRMIMIDPKMLELSVYDNIPHLLTPVVIDPKKAVVALKWAVREMEQRYSKMAKIGVRGVEAFNERVKKAKEKGEVLKRTVQTGFDRETGRPVYEDEILELEPMPFIVVVVDEMADLMMISGKEIEGAVQRLAQMARAAGIHLIAATQRPSVDVITGTIKANFPTRISFQVTSKIDSRTILGEQGAEQLLGQGDMLYMMAGGRIRRVHGPFVSDSEVEDVVRFLKTQGQPDYLDAVTQEADEDGDDPYGLYGNGESGDELYDKAIAIVANERKVSTSYIQRRLQIGYNRAARLIERMEEDGMISKPNHQGKREIMLPEGRN